MPTPCQSTGQAPEGIHGIVSVHGRWIPAFAGMTDCDIVNKSSMSFPRKRESIPLCSYTGRWIPAGVYPAKAGRG